MKSSTQIEAGHPVWRWLFLLLVAAHAAVVLLARTPPLLTDYPDWVYQGVLFAKLLAGHPVPGYALYYHPVPNSVTTLGIGLLTLAVGWQWAAKLWIVIVICTLAGGSLRLLRALGDKCYAVLPVLACGVLLGLDLWSGSINFQFGLALLLFLIAHLLQSNASPYITALLLLLCFFTHMLPCAAGLLAVTAYALQKRSWRQMLPSLPCLGFVAGYVVSRDPASTGGASPVHLVPALAACGAVLLWYARLNRLPDTRSRTLAIVPQALPAAVFILYAKLAPLLGSFGVVDVLSSGLSSPRPLMSKAAFQVFVLPGFLLTLGVLSRLVWTWKGLRRLGEPHRFLGIVSLALALIFLLMPPDALGVTAIDSRFLHLALALGLLAATGAPSRWWPVLGALATVVCCLNLFQFAAVYRNPAFTSTSWSLLPPVGTVPVAPAIRMPYYWDLHNGEYGRWIFPTALFHQVPR